MFTILVYYPIYQTAVYLGTFSTQHIYHATIYCAITHMGYSLKESAS